MLAQRRSVSNHQPREPHLSRIASLLCRACQSKTAEPGKEVGLSHGMRQLFDGPGQLGCRRSDLLGSYGISSGRALRMWLLSSSSGSFLAAAAAPHVQPAYHWAGCAARLPTFSKFHRMSSPTANPVSSPGVCCLSQANIGWAPGPFTSTCT